jgi:magnesium transporter
MLVPMTEPKPNGVRIASLRAGKLAEQTKLDGLDRLCADEATTVWIDLTDPGRELIEEVGRRVGLHPLIAEDIIESNERAKVELIDEHIHVVMFGLTRPLGSETVIDEVDFVLGRRFLLSVHPATWDPRGAHQLKMGTADVLKRGPDFLLWALVDSLVDGYFPVFDAIDDEIDDLEDAVVGNTSTETVASLFRLKRELIRLRHVIAPTREVFAQLTSREFDAIGESTVFYFRDVYDHLIRLTDEFDTFRDLVTGALELYLSTVNNNLSTIMKRLTSVTVVLAGIGAVGGLFGMSEATSSIAGQEGYGFYLVTALTVIAAAVAVWVLHRIGWL